MIPWFRVTAATLLALAPMLSAQRPADPAVAIVQPGTGAKFGTATLELLDVDSDGRADLAYGVAFADGRRELRIHRAAAGTPRFAGVADVTLTIDRRATAFALADVDPAPGRELVLFFPEVTVLGVFAGREEVEYRRLAEAPFLWQPADRNALPSWQAGIVDVDGDGFDDVLLPEPDALTIALQRRDADGVSFQRERLAVPPLRRVRDVDAVARFASAPRDGGRFDLRFGGGPARPETLLRIADTLPSPHLHDVDGDGRRDCVMLRGLDLHVWKQQDGGRFAAAPSATTALPERLDVLLDLAFRIGIRDVDGDDRADLLAVTSRVTGEQTSFVEWFRGGRDGDATDGGAWFRSAAARPDQRLRFPGLVALVRDDDIDGDGRADLVVGRVRTDLLDALTAGGGGKIEARLSVFRGTADGFAEPPMLVHDVAFAGGDLDAQRYDSVAFFADIDGDRQRDLLLRTAATEIAVLRVVRDGAGLKVGDALLRRTVDEDARLATATLGGPVVAIVEPTQITLLSWEGRR